jgi:hypothetical protein
MKPKKKQETGQRMRSQVERTIRSRLGAAFCLHHLTSKVISHGANLRSQIERSKIGAAFACTYLGTPPQNAAILLHSEQQQEATGNAEPEAGLTSRPREEAAAAAGGEAEKEDGLEVGKEEEG